MPRSRHRKKPNRPQQRPILRALSGVGTPPDRMMSQRLLTLLEPYGSLLKKSEETAYKIVGLAVIAWNLSLVPEEEWTESFASLTEEIQDDAVASEGIQEVVRGLIARKRLLYPDDEREILHFEVEKKGEGDDEELRIRTASAPLKR